MKNWFTKFLLICIGCSLVLFDAVGQELDCKVTVNSQKIRNIDQKVFKTFENAVLEFMNNRKWTSDVFNEEERIECSMFINLEQELGSDMYSAQMTIQSSRPVYNSSYNSIMFNFVDKEFKFKYVEFEPLEFNENTFISNLTSMLAFYAYYMIGLDYDSFGKNAGTPYFEKAESVMNSVPSNSEFKGWKPFDGQKNRYWLISEMLNSRYSSYREGLYLYHLQGMDLMYLDPETARRNVLNAMQKVQKVHDDKPSSILVSTFTDAKSGEVVNIFSMGSPSEKTQAKNIISKLDPTNAQKYETMGKLGK